MRRSLIHFANNKDFLIAKASSKHFIAAALPVIRAKLNLPMQVFADGKAVLIRTTGTSGRTVPIIISEFVAVTNTNIVSTHASVCEECVSSHGVCDQIEDFLIKFNFEISVAMNELLTNDKQNNENKNESKNTSSIYSSEASDHARILGIILTGNRQSDVAIVKNGFSCAISAVHPDKTGFNSREVGERMNAITVSRDWLLRFLS